MEGEPKGPAKKPKSLKVAYLLMAVLGFQGAHQFYLGRWIRGLTLAILIHVPTFYFAYLEQQTGGDVKQAGLIPLLAILLGLFSGLGMFIYDLATLPRQARERGIRS